MAIRLALTTFGEDFASSSRGMGDHSWGGSTTGNAMAPANGRGKDKKFDDADFGLFEAANMEIISVERRTPTEGEGNEH